MTVRLRLTLSYAGLVLIAGVLLLAVVWLFLLRYVPPDAVRVTDFDPDGRLVPLFIPGRDDLWEAFAPRAAAAMGFLLLLGLVGGWLLAGRMLAPVARITAGTRLAARGSLSHRIELPGAGDEFRELADSFDAMLARLEAQVAEQQRFAANASHELRTPLAITQAMLDVAGADPDRDPDELIARLRAVNARAIELTEALLALSRAEQRAFVPEPVDLSLLAEASAESLLPLAEARGVTIEVTGPVAVASGSPALLGQLVTNLLHNAIVHNLPAGGRAEVMTAIVAGEAVLTVANTGEALAPALVATLTEPFRRGSERIRGDHDGVGLGLAIAARIVEAHGGRLTLSPRDGGGLHARVRLPAAG